jgi:hypothetical protein
LSEAAGRLEQTEAARAAARADAEAAQAEIRRLQDQATETWHLMEDELVSVRTETSAEMARRLADAASQADASLEENRLAWQAEQEKRLAAIEERARLGVEQARGHWQREMQIALANAEEAAKIAEAARLAAAEAQWREHSDRALALVTGRLEQAEAALGEARARVAHDDAELARLREALSDTRRTIEIELAAARTAWEAELRRHLADAAGEAATALQKARAAWQVELQDHLEKAEQRAQDRMGQAREHWQQESKTALAKAEKTWQVGETTRVTAGLAEATAKAERAEAALAEMRTQAEADQAELRRLRDVLAEVKASIAARESKAAQARAPVRASSPEAAAASRRTPWQLLRGLFPGRTASTEEAGRRPPRAARPRRASTPIFARLGQWQIGQRLNRGAALTAIAVTAYFSIGPLIEPFSHEAETTVEQPSPQAAAAKRTVVGISTANVRAAPSVGSAVVTTLPRDTEVTAVERRGKWVLIQAGSNSAHRQEGWVYGTSLTDGAEP